MATENKAPRRTPYRVSPQVDEWVKGEAERLGISRNAVVEMKLRECMTLNKVEPELPVTKARKAKETV